MESTKPIELAFHRLGNNGSEIDQHQLGGLLKLLGHHGNAEQQKIVRSLLHAKKGRAKDPPGPEEPTIELSEFITIYKPDLLNPRLPDGKLDQDIPVQTSSRMKMPQQKKGMGTKRRVNVKKNRINIIVERPVGVSTVLAKLRAQLHARGMGGMNAFLRPLLLDQDISPSSTRQDLQREIQSMLRRSGTSGKDVERMLDFFENHHSDDWPAVLISALRMPMPECRQHVLRQVFRAKSRAKKGTTYLDPSHHPDVIAGTRQKPDVVLEYTNFPDISTWRGFQHYYHTLSDFIPEHVVFQETVWHMWSSLELDRSSTGISKPSSPRVVVRATSSRSHEVGMQDHEESHDIPPDIAFLLLQIQKELKQQGLPQLQRFYMWHVRPDLPHDNVMPMTEWKHLVVRHTVSISDKDAQAVWDYVHPHMMMSSTTKINREFLLTYLRPAMNARRREVIQQRLKHMSRKSSDSASIVLRIRAEYHADVKTGRREAREVQDECTTLTTDVPSAQQYLNALSVYVRDDDDFQAMIELPQTSV